jgi:P27 family predicted phage terminase small subunit
MAPNRKPTALKQLTGTFRPDREAKRAPMPRRAKPRAPKSLTPAARAYWTDLVALLDDLRVMTPADVTALVLLCEALAEYRVADADVQAIGITYESTTRSGVMRRPNPAVAIRADAWRRVERMLGRFGLTPSDRARVEVTPESRTARRNPWEEIAEGYFDDPTDRLLFGQRGAKRA